MMMMISLDVAAVKECLLQSIHTRADCFCQRISVAQFQSYSFCYRVLAFQIAEIFADYFLYFPLLFLTCFCFSLCCCYYIFFCFAFHSYSYPLSLFLSSFSLTFRCLHW